MKKIIFCGYRKWAFFLLEHAIAYAKTRGDVVISDVIFTGNEPLPAPVGITIKTHYFDGKSGTIFNEILDTSGAELMVFIGWSWLIPAEIVKRVNCICFHPSDLPEFAGGSPIQNQVLADIVESRLTAFKMDEGIDTGPIYKKTALSLLGPIEEVFQKIAVAGLPIIRDLISDYANGELEFTPQTLSRNNLNLCKRRLPSDSIYSISQLNAMSFFRLQNAINVLRDPYPNLCVVINGLSIKLKAAFKTISRPVNLIEISNIRSIQSPSFAPVYLAVLDGFAVITDYSISQA